MELVAGAGIIVLIIVILAGALETLIGSLVVIKWLLEAIYLIIEAIVRLGMYIIKRLISYYQRRKQNGRE